MHFDNGNVKETITNIGFRVKGASSRLNQKKGFVLHFNEFVSGQKFFDMNKLGLKAGSVDDDTLLKVIFIYSNYFFSLYLTLFFNLSFFSLYKRQCSTLIFHEQCVLQFSEPHLAYFMSTMCLMACTLCMKVGSFYSITFCYY